MKVVVAPNALKGSLSAVEAGEAMAQGVKTVFPNAEIVQVPLADGGDGTVETLVAATEGALHEANVSDPLGRSCQAAFGILGDRKTAVIEMAAASGLRLLDPGEYDPMVTTTYGTGELVRAALDEGVDAILLGIGGSATTDGGIGMAQALGARILDRDGQSVGRGGRELERIRRIDLSGIDSRLHEVSVLCACDVDNPLTGERGAAAVYSPQKGATPDMVRELDAGLANLARVISHDLGIEVDSVPGSGAAGGLGAGILAFLGGKLAPGVELVMEYSGLKRALDAADLVLTAEGRVDHSTRFGKVPVGVARKAKELRLPVICFGGAVTADAYELHDLGVDVILDICPEPMSLDAAIASTRTNLEQTVAEAIRIWRLTQER